MCTVLVVEDDASIGALMTALLTDGGHNVTVIQTAQGALPYLHAGGIDLIIADLDRGVYSGLLWNGIDQLRHAAPTTPIIICTGHSEASKVPLREHDVSTVIMKPFDIEEMMTEVGRFTISD
jgi:two-component system, repressor protein LuxO